MRARRDPAAGDRPGLGRVRPGIGGRPVVFFPLLLWLLNAALPVQAGVGMPEIGSLRIGAYRAHLLNDSGGLRRGTNTLTVHIPDLPAGNDVTLRLHGPTGELIDVPLRPLRVVRGPAGGHAVAPASAVARAHESESTASAGHAHGQAPAASAGSDAHPGHRAQPGHRATPAGEIAPVPHAHAHAHGQPGRASGVSGGAAAGAQASDEATHGGATPAEAPGGHGTAAHGGAVFSGFVARGVARLPATGAWRAVLTAGDGRGQPPTGELALTVTTGGPNLLFLGFLGVLSGGSVLYGSIHRRRAHSTG